VRARRFLFQVLILIAGASPACGTRQTTSASPDVCSTERPGAAAAFAMDVVEQLSGNFRITLVDTTGAWSTSRLERVVHLYVNDSTRRFAPGVTHRWGWPRPLAGWVISDANDDYTMMLKSRDPDQPGVIWRGDHLRIGDYDVLDGAGGDNLFVDWYSPGGFGGRWTSDMGFAIIVDTTTGKVLPDAAGYFCAEKLTAAREAVPGGRRAA
jgi:hypothetical protein